MFKVCDCKWESAYDVYLPIVCLLSNSLVLATSSVAKMEGRPRNLEP
jgi:hypothetical protein